MTRFVGCSLLALGIVLATPEIGFAKEGKGGVVVKDTVPFEHWALPVSIANARVSPDGKYLAYVRNVSKKDKPIIEVLEVNNLAKEPHRIGADSMEITGFSWISDTDMTIGFTKQVRKRIQGFNQGASKGKLARYSMTKDKFEELSDDTYAYRLENALVHDPENVIMRIAKGERGKQFRAPNYYKYNLKTGSKELILKGSEEYGGFRFDEYGNPRIAFSRTSDNRYTKIHHRPVGGSGWTEFARTDRESFEVFSPQGFVEGNPNQMYVVAHNGHDKAGLWKYNINTKSFGELVYRHDVVDVSGVVRHSNSWSNPGEIIGVGYSTDKAHRKYFDTDEKNVMGQFEAAIPNAHNVRIISRSKDGNVIIAYNNGPKDPGTYYLYNNGKFKKIGASNGLLSPNDLGNVEYVTYTARDGKKIHGYVTKPKGAGPHPLVVMPHGGPFVSETPSFDPWAQMFANNGYMVLQPQYRGSHKYGLEYYKAGFIDGGQGGFKMQDDKDDGAKYLVDRGLVDPDRMAMFGWSYGGYAALVAASRSPNIYQCVIAGAAVADNLQQVNYYRDRIKGASETEQIRFWDDSISPIKEAEKVNVPMLVIHGSVDQRVPVKHSRKYIDKLKKSGKSFEYVELKDADHFSNTIKYEHKMEFYPKMIEYLQNDCGPDGL